MEELIDQLNHFLGKRVESIKQKGPAEIEITVNKIEDVEGLSEELKDHIVEIIDENTLAKISFVAPNGQEVDSFSLNQ